MYAVNRTPTGDSVSIPLTTQSSTSATSDLERGSFSSYQDYEGDVYRSAPTPKWTRLIDTHVYPRFQHQLLDERRQRQVQFALQIFDLVVLTVFASLVDTLLKRILPVDFLPLWALTSLVIADLIISIVARHILFTQRLEHPLRPGRAPNHPHRL